MVYHLAAQSSAAASFVDPCGTFAANVGGTLHLLEAVRALPEAERPVLLSVGSAEEYGPQPASAYPLKEDTDLNPLSPYGVSKVAQTLLCRQYARSHDLPVIMTRSFSHTGPGHDTRFAFPNFARQIAAAEAGAGPAEITTGNLAAVRDFLDVRDVVAGYRLLLKEGRPGEIYHVSSGNPLTISQGLEILVDAARCPVTVRRDPDRDRPSDTPVMVGDNAKLRAETGWEPEWDIKDTLAALLDEARKEFS
jgi:GDP-4-dehydro-6-deoxy-D-mannose reductase